MKRTPSFHLTVGLIVILFSYLLGVLNQPKLHHPRLMTLKTTSLQSNSGNHPGLGLIVKYRDSAAQSGIDALRNHFGVLNLFRYDAIEPGLEFERLPSNLDINSVLAFYNADPNVEYVEENQI